MKPDILCFAAKSDPHRTISLRIEIESEEWLTVEEESERICSETGIAQGEHVFGAGIVERTVDARDLKRDEAADRLSWICRGSLLLTVLPPVAVFVS